MNEITEIVVLLDRSGSMASVRQDMEGGFATYLAKLREEPGEAYISLHQFDDQYETVYKRVELARAYDLSLIPRGSTALLDAMGKCINETGKRLADLPEAERPRRVMFITITDGGENASREFNRQQISEMVTRQRDIYNWEFVFLGANIDSFGEAGSLGINLNNVANYAQTPSGVRSLFAATAASTNSYRGGGSASLDQDSIET